MCSVVERATIAQQSASEGTQVKMKIREVKKSFAKTFHNYRLSIIQWETVAAEIANKSANEDFSHLLKLENHFRNRIIEKNDDIIFNGFDKNHLPGLINLTIPNISSDLLLIHLDKEGIAISNGSACSSGTINPSPVLKAMGISDKKNLESIRVSAGKHNTIDEVNKLVESIQSSIITIRKNSS